MIALGGNQDDVLLQKGKIMTKEVEVEMSHDQVEHSEAEGEKLKHPRHDDAHQIISKYMGWSAGAGAIPFPVADVVALAAVQTKMIKEILSLYDVTFSEVRIKSSLTILLGSLPPQMLAGAVAGSLTKLIPGVGQVLAPLSLVGLSAAASYAVGTVFVNHLESGEAIEDINMKTSKATFRKAFDEGKKKIKAATTRKKVETSPESETPPAVA